MKAARKLNREDLPDGLKAAVDLALDKKARAPVVLHVSDVTGYTDWLLIVSGRSERHVGGITDGITSGLRERGFQLRGSDGLDHHHWDLLDYGDFIIHVFYHPVRLHYDIESMLRDAPRADLHLSQSAMDISDLDTLEVPESLPAFHGDLAFGAFADELDDDSFEDELDEGKLEDDIDHEDVMDDEDSPDRRT